MEVRDAGVWLRSGRGREKAPRWGVLEVEGRAEKWHSTQGFRGWGFYGDS